MMANGRGQSATEFLITYWWAILIIFAGLAALYYYGFFDAAKYVPRQCNIQPDIPCDSFSLQRNESASPQLRFVFLSHNGLGFDINITNITISAENLGVAGRSENSGSCVASCTNTSLARKGAYFLCIIPIAGEERIPRIGNNARLTVRIDYINCETAPDYAGTGNCSNGARHSAMGEIITQLESAAPIQSLSCESTPTPTPPCGNTTVCESGDTCHECAECEGKKADCPSGYICASGFCKPKS